MSSINTNLGAMVALDTLKGINRNLGQVQNEISTGKMINSARDNAAIWSIATTMESDVDGFEQISNSLNLGSATVGVARTAAEDVVSNLKSIRNNIIAAQENNVDRAKIQTDIDESVAQIKSTVAGAQFNGANLLDSSGSIDILSSLNRSSDGTVTAAKINVAKVNMTTNETAVTAGATVTGDGQAIYAASGLNSNPSGATAITVAATADGGNTTYTFSVNGAADPIVYNAQAGQDQDAIATGIKAAIDAAGVTGLTTAISGGNAITFSGTGDFSVTAGTTTVTETQTVGTLAGIDDIDVTSDANAATALTNIEGFLKSAIDAAAAFGSKQKRLESQSDFVSSIGDSLKAGVSTLTDANLEEASARLQALQVQQQLGVQALSIANQAPQALLSLFR
ncbi:flagellin [uncultured Algimonas sp.]|uniref:flagellin n=1 Tax=uncultured Algimonas sp. TaxID=1547920 RepID=UPI0026291EC2|nr:flagellin [uncultured Algimonas sp.]